MGRPTIPIPADGLGMKTAAIWVHALARSLGIQKARIVGHDIGLMVAYAYAAQFPEETEKLAVDGCLPPGHLALSFQRQNAGGARSWTGEGLF